MPGNEACQHPHLEAGSVNNRNRYRVRFPVRVLLAHVGLDLCPLGPMDLQPVAIRPLNFLYATPSSVRVGWRRTF